MTGYRLLSLPSVRWHVIGLSAYAPAWRMARKQEEGKPQ
jgi:hypothetical protein